MLAQNFKSAAELEISEPQKEALMKTLVLLETGKLTHIPPPHSIEVGETFTGHFNMAEWNAHGSCGTVCCIGGTAELIGGVRFEIWGLPKALDDLFFPRHQLLPTITISEAATALRSYLTIGNANWAEAVA